MAMGKQASQFLQRNRKNGTMAPNAHFFFEMLLYVHREGREPRTATFTFTQLLTSDVTVCSMLLYVHRDHTDY